MEGQPDATTKEKFGMPRGRRDTGCRGSGEIDELETEAAMLIDKLWGPRCENERLWAHRADHCGKER